MIYTAKVAQAEQWRTRVGGARFSPKGCRSISQRKGRFFLRNHGRCSTGSGITDICLISHSTCKEAALSLPYLTAGCPFLSIPLGKSWRPLGDHLLLRSRRHPELLLFYTRAHSRHPRFIAKQQTRARARPISCLITWPAYSRIHRAKEGNFAERLSMQ